MDISLLICIGFFTLVSLCAGIAAYGKYQDYLDRIDRDEDEECDC